MTALNGLGVVAKLLQIYKLFLFTISPLKLEAIRIQIKELQEIIHIPYFLI